MKDDLKFVILLALAVGVNGFVAYEMAGLTLDHWHTISFFAHAYVVLRIAITAAFALVGPGLAIWFWHHATRYVPRLRRHLVR